MFVLGVGLLAGVWFGRPLFPDTAQHRLERDLAAARHLLARSDGNADEARRLAERAREAAEQLPERLGEAELVLGTALMRQAERATTDKAPALWRLAREHLEAAQEQGVPEADRPHLLYRLGKAGFLTGAPLARVIRLLEESVAQADNRAEGYRLLTEAYLKLPQPDLNKALEANRKLRDVAEASEAELSAAKLLAGELYMRLGRPDEARKALEKVGKAAPPGVLAKARLLRARSYQQEGKWEDAVTLYEAVLADGRAPLPEPARVHYDLGVCFRQKGQPLEAGREWRECLSLSSGDEGPAAALSLAKLLLSDPPRELEPAEQAPEKALEMLILAVGKVNKAEDWDNRVADLARARAVFEIAAVALPKAGRFDLALRLAEAYARLAQPGRAAVLRGEFAAEWARLRQQRAEKSNGEARRAEREAARGLYAQAAAAYGEAAGWPGAGDEERAGYLWQGASLYLACQDHAHAVEQLNAYVKAEKRSAQLSEAYYRLGEVLRGTNRPAEAAEAYRNCLSHQTRFQYLARYRLAQAALESGDLDEAEAALVLNLKFLRFESDAEAKEKTLFALGALLYQRRNFRGAVRHLEEALEQFKDNPEATKARYQLADCYRQIAAQENQRSLLSDKMTEQAKEHFQNEHRRWLQKAAEEFTALDRFLDGAAAKGQLSKELRAQVPFIAARCWFNLGEFKTALEIYEGLIERHAGKVEALEALGHAVGCHAGLGQPDMVRQRLLQVLKMLPGVGLDDGARTAWKKWVQEAMGKVKETL
jgi:tetratricopeptide (TPR) repeat protein